MTIEVHAMGRGLPVDRIERTIVGIDRGAQPNAAKYNLLASLLLAGIGLYRFKPLCQVKTVGEFQSARLKLDLSTGYNRDHTSSFEGPNTLAVTLTEGRLDQKGIQPPAFGRRRGGSLCDKDGQAGKKQEDQAADGSAFRALAAAK